uniref:Uncharacterized protein n=1 Tax=Oryza glaberrima TaxID=4538 RepID=I1PYA3_ORYGL
MVVPGAHAAAAACESPGSEREGREEGMRAAAALLHHTAAGRPLPSLLLLPPLPPQIDGQPSCSPRGCGNDGRLHQRSTAHSGLWR